MNFYPIKTDDNTLSLYNFEVNDVYHSKVGAYTEALHKYILPSGLLEFAKENSSIKILDVCYGLGYNSKTAVNEIIKINPDINIQVSALEIDEVVLAFSAIIGEECYKKNINELFLNELRKIINIEEIINNYLEEISRKTPCIENLIPGGYETIPEHELSAKLHNIYYRSLSPGKSIGEKACNNSIKIDFLINDARKSIQNITHEYDFIFHDPFTPSKTPALWTVELFALLNKLLSSTGNLTTYSNAAPVRAAMQEAGFYIGRTTPIGKKSPGTIAYKIPEYIVTPLSAKETGILQTKAGIPYRDKYLKSTGREIILNRQKKQLNSKRISSSRFLKQDN